MGRPPQYAATLTIPRSTIATGIAGGVTLGLRF